MIAIPLTSEAYGAIKASLSNIHNPGPSPQPDGRGGVRVWLPTEFVNQLEALRGLARATATSFRGWRANASKRRKGNIDPHETFLDKAASSACLRHGAIGVS
jgi:hypothetical protein